MNIRNIRRHRVLFISLLVLVVALVGFRAYLPTLIRDKANHFLRHNMKDYTGHIGDVDLHLWRGAADVHKLVILKRNGLKTLPFFEAEKHHVSIQWAELIRGAIVAEIEVTKPKINFVLAPTPKDSQTEVPKDIQKIIQELIPIKINRFAIHDGEIHFRNIKTEPHVDVFVTELQVEGKNLRNTKDRGQDLPSRILASGKVMKSAELKLDLRLDIIEKPLAFDINTQVTGLPLKELNPFFKAYADFDVEKGRADLYSEVAAKSGKIKGYVKPMLTDVEVVRWKKDKKEGLFDVIWEAIVGTGAEVIENQNKNQNAAKIPIEGDLGSPDIDIWEAVGSVITNAFFKALIPGIENSVDEKKAKAQR